MAAGSGTNLHSGEPFAFTAAAPLELALFGLAAGDRVEHIQITELSTLVIRAARHLHALPAGTFSKDLVDRVAAGWVQNLALGAGVGPTQVRPMDSLPPGSSWSPQTNLFVWLGGLHAAAAAAELSPPAFAEALATSLSGALEPASSRLLELQTGLVAFEGNPTGNPAGLVTEADTAMDTSGATLALGDLAFVDAALTAFDGGNLLFGDAVLDVVLAVTSSGETAWQRATLLKALARFGVLGARRRRRAGTVQDLLHLAGSFNLLGTNILDLDPEIARDALGRAILAASTPRPDAALEVLLDLEVGPATDAAIADLEALRDDGTFTDWTGDAGTHPIFRHFETPTTTVSSIDRADLQLLLGGMYGLKAAILIARSYHADWDTELPSSEVSALDRADALALDHVYNGDRLAFGGGSRKGVSEMGNARALIEQAALEGRAARDAIVAEGPSRNSVNHLREYTFSFDDASTSWPARRDNWNRLLQDGNRPGGEPDPGATIWDGASEDFGRSGEPNVVTPSVFFTVNAGSGPALRKYAPDFDTKARAVPNSYGGPQPFGTDNLLDLDGLVTSGLVQSDLRPGPVVVVAQNLSPNVFTHPGSSSTQGATLTFDLTHTEFPNLEEQVGGLFVTGFDSHAGGGFTFVSGSSSGGVTVGQEFSVPIQVHFSGAAPSGGPEALLVSYTLTHQDKPGTFSGSQFITIQP